MLGKCDLHIWSSSVTFLRTRHRTGWRSWANSDRVIHLRFTPTSVSTRSTRERWSCRIHVRSKQHIRRAWLHNISIETTSIREVPVVLEACGLRRVSTYGTTSQLTTHRSRLPKPQTVLLYLYASQQRALPPAFQTAFRPIPKSKSIARVDKWKT